MLPFFPTPYPDELLYSVFARYHIRSGNIYVKDTFFDLFNKKSLIPHALISKDIGILTNKIHGFNKGNLKNWINEHTMFLHYTNFAKDQNKEKLYTLMINGSNNNLPIRITPAEYFKYCPQCVREDDLKYGEIYWHMSHQITGMAYCINHLLLLKDSTVKIQSRHKGYYGFEPATLENCQIEKDNCATPDIVQKNEEILLRISKECKKTADNNLLINYFDLPSIYKYLLYREGYFKGSIVDVKKLTADFTNYYSPELLSFLNVDFDPSHSNCWLKKIIKKSGGVFSPLQHVLLTLFLNVEIDTLHKFNMEIEPFGKGPFPCLNPFSNHYKQCLIKDVRIGICGNTNLEIGIFSCDCGFEFTRATKEPDIKVKQIKSMGLHLENVFVQWLEGEYFHKIGAETKEERALNFKKVFKQYVTGKKRRLKSSEDLIDDCRNKWLHLLKSNPTYSIEKLKKKDIITYKYLYKHDKAWLYENSPLQKYSRDSPVDWKTRDIELVSEIKYAKQVLLNTEPPSKITISSLGRIIKKLDILRKQEIRKKMPKTYKYLDSIIESNEDFQLRRVKYTVKKINETGEKLTENKIRRKAGIHKGRSDYVDAKIRKYVQESMQ